MRDGNTRSRIFLIIIKKIKSLKIFTLKYSINMESNNNNLLKTSLIF